MVTKPSLENSWKPSLKFLRGGVAEHDGQPVTWTFESIADRSGKQLYMRCSLEWNGVKVNGFGDRLLRKSAMIQALAEAWERACMMVMQRSKQKSPLSSNGFAAGRNSEEAAINARAELLERHIFLTAWRTQRYWKVVRNPPFRVKLILADVQSHGWDWRMFEIPTVNHGRVVCVLAKHPSLGAVFDSTYSDKPSVARHFKVARSISKATHFPKFEPMITLDQLPSSGSPHHHAQLYRNPLYLPAFDFLSKMPDHQKYEKLELQNVDAIETKLVCNNSAMPPVAQCTNSYWDPMIWGRESIKGQNPWPHPLA